MEKFIPKNIPEMVIEYNIADLGQKETRDQPGFKPTIEIINININSDYISEGLFFLLMEQYEGEWISDIQESLNGIDRNVY